MPSISISLYNSLLADKARLEQIQRAEAMRPFVTEAINSLGMLLANKPFKDWPDIAKLAYKHAGKGMPTGYALYMQHLPKD